VQKNILCVFLDHVLYALLIIDKHKLLIYLGKVKNNNKNNNNNNNKQQRLMVFMKHII
jgi:hypothetical protein